MLKTILFTLLLFQVNIYATDKYIQPPYDQRLDHVKDAKDWFYTADKLSDSAFNLGVTYHKKFKDYKQAEFWYKQAYRLNKNDSGATNNLGYLYNDLKEYDKAIQWYKKTYELNDASGALNLGVLYENNLKNYKEAVKWYKIAIKKGNFGGANNLGIIYEDQHKYNKAIKWYIIADKNGNKSAALNLALLYKNTFKKYDEAIKWNKEAIKKGNEGAFKNIGRLYYHQFNDKINAAQYYIALINNPYPKEKILSFLKNNWHISNEQIQEAYTLQLNSKIIPEKLKYRGGI